MDLAQTGQAGKHPSRLFSLAAASVVGRMALRRWGNLSDPRQLAEQAAEAQEAAEAAVSQAGAVAVVARPPVPHPFRLQVLHPAVVAAALWSLLLASPR